MDTRKSVFICNLAIIALCIASIVAYFIMPFWSINIKYTLTAEMLEELLPESANSDSKDANSLYSGIDFGELLDEDIELKLSIELQTAQVLGAMSGDSTKLVENILYDNVHNIVDQIDPHINTMVKKLVKTVVKDTFKNELKNQIKETLGEGTTDEKTQEELNNMGLDDEYIDTKTTQLIETIYAEGTTVDDAVNETVSIVKDSIEQMRQSGAEEYANVELSPEAEEDLKQMLEEKFEVLKKDDGTIDPEAFTSEFLLSLLQGENIDPDLLGGKMATPLSAKSNDLNNEQKDAKEELKKELTNKLMSILGGTTDIIATVLKYVGYVVIFTFIVWAIPILNILLRITKENNAIKLGLPIWLGWLPFLVLYLVPSIALSSLSTNIAALSSLSITFSTCAIVSAIAAVALAVLAIFFYGRWRKELSY